MIPVLNFSINILFFTVIFNVFQINLKNSNIILVGGGANILYPTFLKLYPQTIVNEDVKLQCQGLYNIAEKLFK